MKFTSALALLPLLALPAAPAQTKAAPPTLISACVGKFGGLTRIVASTSLCDARLETPVQWNQQGVQGPSGTPGTNGSQGATGPKGDPGPTGATGATGPAGLGLAHIIPVPLASPTLNKGEKGSTASPILTILASLTDASADNRYELLLDAGTYNIESAPKVPATLTLPQYISLKGAGPGVTFLNTLVINLTGDNTLSGFSTTAFTVFSANALAGSNFISQVEAGQSSANFTAATSTGVSLTVRDSTFGAFTSSTSPTVRLFLTGSHFFSLGAPPDGSATCLADYVDTYPLNVPQTNCSMQLPSAPTSD